MRTVWLTIGVIAMCASLLSASYLDKKPSAEEADSLATARMRMVDRQLVPRGLTDSATLAAMRVVPRHRFVPPEYRRTAYGDHPLPIGEEQTISQPYIVGAMTEALALSPTDKILEIGTGSGYQAAVLAEIVSEVYTIEIIASLGRRAESTLTALFYDNVHVRIGDGYRGWPEEAPFDGIIVTAAPDHVPQPLIDQLAIGGRLVLPVGEQEQHLMVLTKTPEGIIRERRFGVRFVPMTGEAETPMPEREVAPLRKKPESSGPDSQPPH